MTKLKIEAIKDNIVTVSGKHPYQFLEVVTFANKTEGVILKADVEKAEVGLLSSNQHNDLEVGGIAIPSGKLFQVNIYNDLLGSILDVSLNPLISTKARVDEILATQEVFEEAKPIYSREAVRSPLETGVTVVDAILPIGKGQKQLILGDKGTGKTAIALNAILAQFRKETINIFVGIGKKREEIVEIYSVLRQREVIDQSIILTAAADDLAVAKYLIPYVGAAVAEYFQAQGKDVLVVFDDLTNHADAYRELALLSGSSPGREAFPGDIFYTHSRLLERAGRYSEQFNGGSITMLPIAQTLDSDISGYIPTNLISITDGQIFTSTALFNAGKRPAIDIGLSVSRIGSQAQEPIMVKASSGLKRQIADFERQKRLATFGQNLDKSQIDLMDTARVFEMLTDQGQYEVIDYHTTAILVFLLKKGYLSFYKDNTENLVLVKDVLKVFFAKDILGSKLRKLIRENDLESDIISQYVFHMILPLLKYHLLSDSKYLSKNKKFIELYKNVRNDGRVLLAYERRGLEKGIAYEYN
ncbi:F-type H+-transporting ATPase subunit alpha [Mycoplasma testudineum]|uniref:F-type H+-transporting ATPase subunit alpha n=1 Tax=Mycoplasma testudineum TaxID=244584 RepID=A0A4R6IEX2_9MOLU|nr:F0F1 ATP synthase subunit alpha [Mycoplasma testudineum]OYD26988.1 F0F1 ATP synthase subunit alpha [Mycoplasma testudineum]TDO20534.1 F-type H+-transporting ATPase subunit alpha [Mycoplasma testudineum]